MMVVNLIVWTFVGILIGLWAYYFVKENHLFFWGTLSASVVGSLVGGLLYLAIKVGEVSGKTEPGSYYFSLIGSIALIILIRSLISSEINQDNSNKIPSS